MKYIYLLCTVVGFGLAKNVTIAQTNIYHPFPDSNTFWGINGTNIFNSYICHDIRFGINGDTVMNDKVYHKVYSLFDSTLLHPASEYYAAIREENKRVYTVFPDQPEQLLYDFNLLVGDTLFLVTSYGYHDPFSRVVVSVDSMQIYNGQFRKRWILEPAGTSCFTSDVVVEGLGSIVWRGLFNPLINDIPLNGDTYNVECIKQNEAILFLDNQLCDHCFCSLLTTVEAEPQIENREVFPNPFSETTCIKMPSGSIGSQILLYNTTGQTVRKLTTGTESVFVFHRENLPAGVYCLQIEAQNEKKRSIKIIITDR